MINNFPQLTQKSNSSNKHIKHKNPKTQKKKNQSNFLSNQTKISAWTYRWGSDSKATTEGLEASIEDLPSHLIDLDLELHDIATGGCTDEARAHHQNVLVQKSNVAGPVVVVDHPLVVHTLQHLDEPWCQPLLWGFVGCWEILEDLGRFDLVVVLCWLLGFMDLIAGDMGLGFGSLLWRLIMGKNTKNKNMFRKNNERN